MPEAANDRTMRFQGRIAGFGTASGTRIVVGMWEDSPLGAFSDVMIERPDGHRVLLAPTAEASAVISATYRFDEIRIVPVRSWRVHGGLAVEAGGLSLVLRMGGLSPLGRVLRAVPRPLATNPLWLTVIDPVARMLAPGSATAGTAGQGRREYYGVTAARRILDVRATEDGESLGALHPLTPPVRFGFASAPAEPTVVDVVTTIVLPHPGSAAGAAEPSGAAGLPNGKESS